MVRYLVTVAESALVLGVGLVDPLNDLFARFTLEIDVYVGWRATFVAYKVLKGRSWWMYR